MKRTNTMYSILAERARKAKRRQKMCKRLKRKPAHSFGIRCGFIVAFCF